jgi:hypothetical protein
MKGVEGQRADSPARVVPLLGGLPCAQRRALAAGDKILNQSEELSLVLCRKQARNQA